MLRGVKKWGQKGGSKRGVKNFYFYFFNSSCGGSKGGGQKGGSKRGFKKVGSKIQGANNPLAEQVSLLVSA